MPTARTRSFSAPDEVRDIARAHIEILNLDDVHVGRCRFDPGWRWSEAFGPMLGTSSCPLHHVGYTISGVLHVVMDDGQELDVGPGSVFDIPPGHDKWVVGDVAWETIEWGGSGRAMQEALREDRGRMLGTILFTDIVDSTARLRSMGDGPWRDHLASHNRRMRELLNVHRGREVATTGDGFLALFDSPTRGVRCALAMVGAAQDLGTPIRAAVHTGEVELAGDDVRGIAVHLAARVLALADAGEVLITGTTADLVDGAGIPLEDAGLHDLKGIVGRRPLFRALRS